MTAPAAAAGRPIRRVAVIGAGTVGASWTALFLAHGLEVVAQDPAPAVLKALAERVAAARPALQALGLTGTGRLTLEREAEAAAEGADFVQENAPESYALKVPLLARLDQAAPAHALIASSTSSLQRGRMVVECRTPERVIVAHPFNPPHLVPLVEIVGADPGVVERASAFYAGLGKEPVVLKRDAVGHVANRLTAALLREALYMVEQDIADVAAIDRALKHGPGLRWAAMGPFLTYHLGGGSGGIRHYLEHLGPSQVERWKDLGTPDLNAALRERVAREVEESYGDTPLEELAEQRDATLLALLRALAR